MTRADRERIRFAVRDLFLCRQGTDDLDRQGVDDLVRLTEEGKLLPGRVRNIVAHALKRWYVHHARTGRRERAWARAFERGTPLVERDPARGARRRAVVRLHRTERRAYLRLYREVTNMGGSDTEGRPSASPDPSP